MELTPQYFKPGDEREIKLLAAFRSVHDTLVADRVEFFEDAYTCFKLGEVLYDLNRDPMVPVLQREFYRTSYFAIHDLFTRPGTFEFYLDVFRAIFGEDVDVTFTVPDPGHLQIDMEAVDVTTEEFEYREIVDNEYEFGIVTDEEDDAILFQIVAGIRTQREIDALILELSPAGVYTEANLVT